jgi:hypothetical protein
MGITTFGSLIAIQNLISAGTPAAVISISYGECEVANGAASNAATSPRTSRRSQCLLPRVISVTRH